MVISRPVKKKVSDMNIFINAGHDIDHDAGATNEILGITEAEIALKVSNKVSEYLQAVGLVTKVMQSDNLNYDSVYPDRPYPVCVASNEWPSDLFISIHCNAFNTMAHGTECLVYSKGGNSERLANCIQAQIVNSLDTTDRGIKERPDLTVLRRTDCTATLVEMAFIDHPEEGILLRDQYDEFAKAIARGVTDYIISQ